MGDWSAYVNLPEAIQAVSVDNLKEVARKYFIERNCTTGGLFQRCATPLVPT